jgi:hypothetical protein
MLKGGGVQDPQDARRKALAACGQFDGPDSLAARHDDYLAEAYDQSAAYPGYPTKTW